MAEIKDSFDIRKIETDISFRFPEASESYESKSSFDKMTVDIAGLKWYFEIMNMLRALE